MFVFFLSEIKLVYIFSIILCKLNRIGITDFPPFFACNAIMQDLFLSCFVTFVLLYRIKLIYLFFLVPTFSVNEASQNII